MVPVGPGVLGTIAYEMDLRLVAGWNEQSWTWCANAVVTFTGSGNASGTTIVGALPEEPGGG